MNILTERCKSILSELINNDIITLKYLEETVKVSKRTLVKDLDVIEEFLKGFEVKLVRKPKKGLWLIGEEEKKVFLQVFVNADSGIIPISSKERQDYIITKLINSNKYVTIQDLADEMYVSKGTIANELPKIEEVLKCKSLSLEKKQNKGMIIQGEEVAIRQEYANLIKKKNDLNYMLNMINQARSNESNENLQKYLDDELFKIFNRSDVRNIVRIIKGIEIDLGYLFSDSAFIALVIHIVIAIKRIRNGNKIEADLMKIEKLKSYVEYDLAIKIIKQIEQSFELKMPEEEVGYIAMHILGSKISKIEFKNLEKDIIIDSIENKILKDEILLMINKAEEVLQVKLSNDNVLYEGLIVHVRPAINRLVNKMTIKNPYLEDIKKKYPIAFEAGINAFEVLKERYNVKSDEDEIAYIALHFEAALERIKRNNEEQVNVLVVCSTGMGTSQLVSAKLRRLFTNINILDVVSAIDIENNSLLSKADIIISTIPLFAIGNSVINVNPFLSDDDVKKIEAQFKQLYKNKNRLNYDKFNDIYNENLVMLNQNFKNKEELITEVCRMLEKNNYVTKNYIKTVISRESISSTDYEDMAIPHGDHNEVIKPCIVICTLKNPIKWGIYKVKIVFLVSVNKSIKDNLKDVFNNLYELFEDKNRLNKIMKSTNANEIIQLVSNVK